MYSRIKLEIEYWERQRDKVDMSEDNPMYQNNIEKLMWINGRLSAYHYLLSTITGKNKTHIVRCGSYYKNL